MTSDLNCDVEWDWEIRTREHVLVARPSTKAWDLTGDRRLSDLGEQTLTIQSDCCDTIDNVETGDELLLYRDNSLVWYGPCKKATRQAPFGQAVIQARDRLWWWTGRYFGFPVNWTGQDAGISLEDLIEANAAVDPLVAIQWFEPPPGFMLNKVLSLIPVDTSSFKDVLDSLAQAVLDYTLIGDKLLVGLEGTPVPPLPLLSSDSWDSGRFTTVQDHELFSTQVTIDGKNALQGTFPPVVTTPPFVPPPDPRWGARTTRIGDDLLSDVAACLTRAKAEYGVRNPPQRRLSVPDGALVDHRVLFSNLIPGASCIVEAPTTCETTTLIDMLLATVKWEVRSSFETNVTAALVEKGLTIA